MSNGLCSDLGSGTVYVLAHNGVEISVGGTTVSQLIQLDPLTGGLTGTIVELSMPIITGASGSNGVFSGNGRVVIHNGSRVYDILLPSGEVTDLGLMSMPPWMASENWAIWGVAEQFGGNLYLAYRAAAGHTIVRRRVPDGLEQTIATFTNLSDLASWTVAPALGRWYFHHENGSQFGGIGEVLGYATATFDGPHTQPPVISSVQEVSGFVGTSFSFQILANRSPLSYAASGLPGGLSLDTSTGLISGTPTTAGTFQASISCTNWVGTTTVPLTLIVYTQFPAVAVFADPAYVNATSLAQMQASLTGMGCPVTTFTGIAATDWNTAFSNAEVVVMPSFVNLSPSSELREAINQNLAAGKGLVQTAGASGKVFLNSLRIGTPLDTSGISNLALTKVPGLSGFSNSPGMLPARTGVYFTYSGYLPDGSQSIYNNGSNSGAWFAGRIGSLGYNWAHGADAAWDAVLRDMLDAVRGYLTGPEIVVLNYYGAVLADGSTVTQNIGYTAIGEFSERDFTIRNEGFAQLSSLIFSIEGAHPTDFSISTQPVAALAPLASTSFTVRFAPSAAGARTATLRIASNDADESPFDIPLAGTGFVAVPEISVQAGQEALVDGTSNVSFVDTPVTGSSRMSFGISSTGTGSLKGVSVTIDGTHAGDFTVSQPPPPVIAASDYVIFEVRFSPSATGSRTAQLHIASNDANENPFDITLTGTGIPLVGTASLFTDPTYTEGPEEGTTASFIRTSLSVMGYAVTDFTGTSAEAWDAAFDAGVVVLPPLTSNFVLTENAQRLVNNHLDGGKGLVVMGAPSGRASSFLNTLRGWSLYEETYDQQAHTPMSKIMGLLGFAASPPVLEGYQWIYNLYLPYLPAGARVPYFEYLYAPIFTHQHAAFMGYQWGWGDPSEALLVLGDLMTEVRLPVAGPEIGVARSADGRWLAADGSTEARPVYAPLGSESIVSFTLRNFGGQPLLISGISIEGTNASDFTISTPPAASVAAGMSTSISVRFTPSAVGNRHAVLRLTSNDPDETAFKIALEGVTQPILFEDDFDPGIDTPLWSSIDGASANTFAQAAGPGSTDRSLHFYGAGSRQATTIPLDTTSGGTVSFKIALGSENSPSYYWRPVAPGSEPVLEYSTDGVAYTSVGGPYTNQGWGGFQVEIPLAARTAATRFRWHQPVHAGSTYANHWAIEDVRIGPGRIAYPEISVEKYDAVLVNGAAALDGFWAPLGGDENRGLVIRNTGWADLTGITTSISGPNAADFTITTPLASTLTPGGASLLNIRFTPQATGDRTATLQIFSSDADESPFIISLAGSGYAAAPEIHLEGSLGSLPDGGTQDFGTVNAGSSGTVSFAVINYGSAPLTGLAVTIDGADAALFAVASPPAATVSPGGYSTTFSIRFSPLSNGAKSAVLHLSSNDEDENPYDVMLTGTGFVYAPEIVVEQPAGTVLTDNLSAVDFGSVVTVSNTTRTFTVRNTGNQNLTGLNVTFAGADAASFTIATPPVSAFAPGLSTTFQIRFAPTVAGSLSAVLRLASNDADENPFDIPLTGTGVAPTPEIEVSQGASGPLVDGAASLTFANALPGAFSQIMITLQNTGTAALNGISASFSGGQSSVFGLFTTPPVSIPAGGSARFTVRFSPTATGAHTTTLRLFSNDADESPFDIMLNGFSSTVVTEVVNFDGLEAPSSSSSQTRPVSDYVPPTVNVSTSTMKVLGGGSSVSPNNLYWGSTYTFGASDVTLVFPSSVAGLSLRTASTLGASTQVVAFDESGHVAYLSNIEVSWIESTVVIPVPRVSRLIFSTTGYGGSIDDVTYTVSTPAEIAIEQPAGVNLADGAAAVSFGSAAAPVTRTFTIRNMGGSTLSSLGATFSGAHAADFSLVTSPPASLSAGGSSSFTVRFSPFTPGARSASLRIASNDADENPFDIVLDGVSVTPAGGLDAWLPAGLPDRTPQGTPHDDGIANLLRYAFNLNSNAPDQRVMAPGGTSGLPVIGRQQAGAATVFRFEFLRRIGSGLQYTPEKTSTLDAGGWTPLLSPPIITPVNEFWERVVYEEPVDSVTVPACFGRVRVLLP
ncbi:MAG: choice-of-anchor D domain-containing protein [Prosthecobacter sp.]